MSCRDCLEQRMAKRLNRDIARIIIQFVRDCYKGARTDMAGGYSCNSTENSTKTFSSIEASTKTSTTSATAIPWLRACSDYSLASSLLFSCDQDLQRLPFNPSIQPFNPFIRQALNPSSLQPVNPSTLQPFNTSTLQPFNDSTLQPFNPSTLPPFHSLVRLMQ